MLVAALGAGSPATVPMTESPVGGSANPQRQSTDSSGVS
jgi:hypothetical protein